MASTKIYLLNNEDEAGYGEWVSIDTLVTSQVAAYGGFNGSTVKLQYSPDGGATGLFIKDSNGADISLTEPQGGMPIRFTFGELARAVVYDGSPGRSITVTITPLAP